MNKYKKIFHNSKFLIVAPLSQQHYPLHHGDKSDRYSTAMIEISNQTVKVFRRKL